MWGEGRAGKLGHGSNADVARAARVEALVGRAHVRSVALGDSHSLFLDEDGGVWGCGENKEGQLGCELMLPRSPPPPPPVLSWR